MFRNIAIALVAASVLAAPAMAQNPTLSGGQPSQSKPATESPEKADKTPEKSADTAVSTEKSAKHHRVAGHHRHHGAKAAKLGKTRTSTALYGKHHGLKASKYAKVEGRHMGHGRKGATHTYGRAPKHMRMHTPPKSSSSPSVD